MRKSLGALALAVLLVPSIAAAQTKDPDQGPTADLAMAMHAPATTPLVESTFQLGYTITNNGPEQATSTAFSQYIPPELKVESVSSSDGSPCVTGEQGGTTTAPPPATAEPPKGAPTPTDSGSGSSSGGGTASPGYYGDSVSCDLGTMDVGESTTITLDLRRIGARETYTSAWVGSALNDSIYDNNYADLTIEADTSNPADVAVTMDSPQTPDVGADFTYRLTVTNNGPSTAKNTTLSNPIGYGLSYVSAQPARGSDNCKLNDYSTPDAPAPEYGGYTELECNLDDLAAGDSTTVDVTVNRASAYEIWNSASVQTANYDGNYDNDYAYFSIPADPSVTSDLGVDVAAPKAPLVGSQFDLAVTVTNHGPAASGDVEVTDYLPPDLEFVSSNDCSYNDYGHSPMADAPTAAPSPNGSDAYYPIAYGGVYCAIGSVEKGKQATATITVRRTNAREIWNSAWVWSSNYDPNYDNNYSDQLIEPDKSKPADVAVTMDAPKKPDVGSDFSFTAAVTNNGPSPAENVQFTDYVPFGVDYKAVSSDDPADTCTFDDERYDAPPPGSLAPIRYGLRLVTCDMGTLDPGTTDTITIEVTRQTEYEIWNSGAISISNYDENYDNDYASVLVEGQPYPGACPAKGDADGTAGPDSIVVGDCNAETGGGADSVELVPSSSRDSSISSGRGPDTINVDLSVGSSERRRINVKSGRGRDLVRIKIAPGAGHATIHIAGGSGNDTVEIDAPAGRSGLRLVVDGGGGNDTIQWTGATSALGAVFPGFHAYGGNGTDLLQGGLGPDRLDGGPGGDRLYGGLSDDVLRGGSGYDVCRGGPGTNTTDC